MRAGLKKISVLLIAILCLCTFSTVALAADVGIKIETPSATESTIAPGRSFYVMGTFANGESLSDGDKVTVELKDPTGKVIRCISTTIKDNTSMYIDYPKLSYYGSNKDELLTAGMPDLIWDGSDEASFHNGDVKLYYNEKEFAALIPGGEGVLSEGLELVDGSGNKYDVLPEGEYTICVTVTDQTDTKNDDTDAFGTAEKKMNIGVNASKLLSRFSPKAHNSRVTEFVKANNYRIYTDLFPGYWSKGNIFCEILPEWRAADATEYLAGKVHFVIYNLKGSSASYAVEVAILQETQSIDDPERLQCYYYAYGEPALPDAAKTVSPIVSFEAGDKMQLVRAETTTLETADNIYQQDAPEAENYDLDLSDGVQAKVGETVSVYGVTAPIQLSAADIVDNGDNSYTLNNKISTVRYRITGDGVDTSMEKEVKINRVSGGWDNYSEFEFKHDLKISEDMLGKQLKVEAAGYDAHGALVKGTEEQFTIAVSAELAAEGGRPGEPGTGDAAAEYRYVIMLCIALAAMLTATVLEANDRKHR